ncbi:PAS domain-containing sensor histidine kinase [Luteithermobacter gelatinilyticus]|uniref:PAS domain-containing sensor histidine kinase n=1 Tax=Luteithermobacter gelatinilyticus TaxID=2582913 RepID=UPI00143D7285|nr:PAS-domain containing protein [Luteithermobacter gelatinilyticus]
MATVFASVWTGAMMMAAMLLPSPALCAIEVPAGIGGAGDQTLLVAFAIFCLLAFVLLGLMLYHRTRLNRRLNTVEQRYDTLKRLLSSRDEVYLTISGRGHLKVSNGFEEWFGVDGVVRSLDNLKKGVAQSSLSEFHRFRDCCDRLVEEAREFSLHLRLKQGERWIAVQGLPLKDPRRVSEGSESVIWFRGLSREESIALHQQQEYVRLRQQQQFYKMIADQVALPFWVRDKDLNLTWVNQAYVNAVEGESRQQVLRDNQELVTTSLGKSARDMALMAEKTGEVQRDKHFVVIRGERRAMDIHNIPLYDETGLCAFAGYAVDITELEEARGELIHHTESHSETLNKLSTAVAIFGIDKRLEYYNSAFARLWQIPEEILFSHPHHGEVLEAMREARKLPEQANFLEWKRKQLEAYTQLLEPVEEMWHLPDETTLRVVTQPHPQGGLLIFYEDVTDHLALERSYNTLFAVQQETLNNLHEGVAVFGVDGRLQLYNPGFAEMWALDREFLNEGPHVSDVMAACDGYFTSPDQSEEIRGVVVGDVVKTEGTSRRLRRSDETVVDFFAVSLPDGGVLTTYIDVTDSFRIEQALRERNQALEETDRIKTEFLAHMSYELRTPLNSIIGFAELLAKEYQGPLNDDQHAYMRHILQASDRLLGLINDILDLAVIEAGGMTLEVSRFRLKDMLAAAMNEMTEAIRAKGLEVELDCPDDLGMVCGDSKRLQHCILNLLSNAVKFTPAPGFVTIGVREEETQYRIFVKDSGIGILPEEQNRIFEKFYTGSNVSNGQGVGLGLSLVKSFMEMHGGRVEVDSQPDIGTTVTCYLPKEVPVAPHLRMVGE